MSPAAPESRHGWMDGHVRPLAELSVPVTDRTLLYGLGAFETVRLWGGRPYLLPRHHERLARSLAALGLPLPPAAVRVEALADGLAALSRACGTPDALARITVTSGARDEGPAGMHVFAVLRAPPRAGDGRFVRVGLAASAHPVRSPLTGVKSTSYLVHYLLREAAEAAGRDDDLLFDEQDHVTEATVSNVFGVADGVLLTPPLSEGILAGVTRGRVLELAAECGQPAREATISRAALDRLDECFLTGAGKCLLAVDELAGRRLPAGRPVSTRLAAALADDIARHCGVARQGVRF